MINVLYVNDNSSLLNGSSNALISILKGLDREKFCPYVSIPNSGPLVDELTNIKVKTFIGDWNYLWIPTQKAYYKYVSGIKERVAYFEKIIRENKIDILHCNSIFAIEGLFASYKSQCHSLLHVHVPLDTKLPLSDFFSIDPITFGSLIQTIAERIVVVSKEMRDSAESFINPEIIDVIYNGIDTDLFHSKVSSSQVGIREELNIEKDVPLICSVGRLIARKGFDDYIHAASIVLEKVPDAQFILIGPEEDKSLAVTLKDKVKDLSIGESFHFLGPRQDVPAILNQIDLFVCTSLWEGHPIVCLEAMAAGKPVIATDWGSTGEVLTDGETALIVEPGNPAQITQRIIQLLENPDIKKKLAKNGFENVQTRFSSKACATSFQNLYHNLIKSEPNNESRLHCLEFVLNAFSEIGELGFRSLEHDWRLKQLERFVSNVKENVFFRCAKKVYKSFVKPD
jgi:glycosyltransferase involved in cell wall biosynthesis